jgi:cytochrome bd-type quinol oxidase subunit 2
MAPLMLKLNDNFMKTNYSTLTLEESIPTEVAGSSVKVIPTFIYASVFASFCIAIGLQWDISWHMSVGRDGLFSPPHLAIYLGAVISGIFSGVKVLQTSFWGSLEEKQKTIRFWGIFHGSLGAMFCIWGAFAMLTSAPFDDWWHNTYGLDVKILSPPHAVLGLGMIMIQFGALISVIAVQNRLGKNLQDKARTHLQWLFVMSSGFLLVMGYTFFAEYFFMSRQHHVLTYQVVMATLPILMVSVAYASPYKWGATKMAVVYTLLMAGMVWILPLFPAEPKLSPVYNYITRFQPFHFPFILIVPALVIDMVIAKWKNSNKWILAAALSIGFVLSFVPAQWYFAELQMSEYGRGWFFGRYSLPYFANPDSPYRYIFHPDYISQGWDLIRGLGIATLIGLLTCRLALAWGNWMSQVKR